VFKDKTQAPKQNVHDQLHQPCQLCVSFPEPDRCRESTGSRRKGPTEGTGDRRQSPREGPATGAEEGRQGHAKGEAGGRRGSAESRRRSREGSRQSVEGRPAQAPRWSSPQGRVRRVDQQQAHAGSYHSVSTVSTVATSSSVSISHPAHGRSRRAAHTLGRTNRGLQCRLPQAGDHP